MKIRKISFSDRDEWRNEEGQLHRDNDLPAVVYLLGEKHWYKNGNLYREGDFPVVENVGIYTYYVKNGKFHRETGPAYMYRGVEEWWIDGMFIGNSDNLTNEKFLKLMSPKLKLLWNGNIEELIRIAKIL